MIVITLSEEDLAYISELLEKAGSEIHLMKMNGTLPSDVCDRLVRKNSGIHSIFEARLVPYVCILTDIKTKEIYHLSFKDFGKFPSQLNESQIMSYIADWAVNHDYEVEFKRENKMKAVS